MILKRARKEESKLKTFLKIETKSSVRVSIIKTADQNRRFGRTNSFLGQLIARV